MATILEQFDSIPCLANSHTWCLFRQRIEQPEAQRKLILIAVCVALLLDNMLYMVIVPIIPDYLRKIDAWSTHKEGGEIEYKQVTNWQLTTQSTKSLINKFETIENLSGDNLTNLLSTTKSPDKLDSEQQQEDSEDEYNDYKQNKEEEETEIAKRKPNDELNRLTTKVKEQQLNKNEKNKSRHHHLIAVRTGSHTVYEGEDLAIGLLFASKAIVQLVVNPFSGTIIDRLGYEMPMFFGLSVLFVSTAIFACGRSYGVLFFARSLQGVGSAFADTGGFAMIADRFTEPNQREKALGIALSFVSFGCLFAPPFGGFLYEFYGKQLPFIVLSLICLLDGFLVVLIMAPVKRAKSRRSSLNLTKINGTGQYQLNSSLTDETPQATPIYVLFRDKFIAVCAGALVMANISLACLEPTISIWMKDTMQAEEWQLGMIWLPSFFPYVFGVYFTLNFNRKHPSAQYLIAICGLALTGLSCLVIPLSTNYYQLFIPIAVLCFGVAVIDTAVFPLLAYIVDSRYVSIYGSVYAIADISYSIAYAVGPIFAGNIMGLFGFVWLNIFIAILVVAYCPVLLSLKQLYEYNVIDDNCLEGASSKPSSSLDENSIMEDNLCVNSTVINNHSHSLNSTTNNSTNSSFNNSIKNPSAVELNMNRINCLKNCD